MFHSCVYKFPGGVKWELGLACLWAEEITVTHCESQTETQLEGEWELELNKTAKM